MTSTLEQATAKSRFVVSVPTNSDIAPEDAFIPPRSAQLTADEIAEAMMSAGVALGIDGLAADLSNSIAVTVRNPMIPNRLLLQFLFASSTGVYDFEGGSSAYFPISPGASFSGQVRLRLRPIANTVYLFDLEAVMGSPSTFTYHILNSGIPAGQGLNVIGESPEVDGHALFAVKAPSGADLAVRIYAPVAWHFYGCRITPQS